MESCWEVLLTKTENELDQARLASAKATEALSVASDSLKKINELLSGYLQDLSFLEKRSHTMPEVTFIRQAILQLQNVQAQAQLAIERAEKELSTCKFKENDILRECKKYEKLIARDNERQQDLETRREQSELDAIGLQLYINKSRDKTAELY